MVSGFAKLGAYFSFSGYLMSMKSAKAKKMLKAVRMSYSTGSDLKQFVTDFIN